MQFLIDFVAVVNIGYMHNCFLQEILHHSTSASAMSQSNEVELCNSPSERLRSLGLNVKSLILNLSVEKEQ